MAESRTDHSKFPKSENTYLYIALILTTIYASYWTLHAISEYNNFHTYETSYIAYAMYLNLNYPNLVHGLQSLIFINHIAPDQLLVLPLFYFYQSSLFLLIFQVAIMALTGIIVFFVSQDLLKNSSWALIFCFAFFLNPGINAMLIADYHVEALIPLFYILTFYYYMKLDKKLFYVSLALLLGVMETMPLFVLPLGVGLFVHEHLHKEKEPISRQRKALALQIIWLSFTAMLLYNVIYFALTTNYSTNYPNLPGFLVVGSYPLVPAYGQPLTPAFYRNSSTSTAASGLQNSLTYPGMAGTDILGLEIVFLSFGIGALFDLVLGIMLALPWLIGLLILGNTFFANLDLHYYSLVISGAFIAALLGIKNMLQRKELLSVEIKKPFLHSLIKSASLTLILMLFLEQVLYISYTEPDVFTSDFLFALSPAQMNGDLQLNAAIAHIPQNASLLAQDFIAPHVINREYLRYVVVGNGYNQTDKANYLIFDLAPFNGRVPPKILISLIYIIQKQNYTLYYESGNVMLYKRSDATR